MFSSRLPAALAANAVSRARAELTRSGAVVLDLTETNPTAVGLSYTKDIPRSFDDPDVLSYHPDPRGLAEARKTVATLYRDRGIAIDADQIVLTASTSEAYAFLFKLLCDPGDAVHVPQPSYPLFDLIAALEAVAARPYRLNPFDAGAIDQDGLLASLVPDSRAILVVSPNNPTGSMLRAADRAWLVDLARRREMALVSDEVFSDYRLSPLPDASSLAGEPGALTFTLGGLSKSAGLPQMKLAWIVVSGPAGLVKEALERLEVIADTYLSVSTPVQVAAARLIEAGRSIRHAVIARLRENLGCLRSHVRAHPALTLFEPEGGWSAVVRIPAVQPEEDVVLRLLREAHVLVHPGYFFDFQEEAFLVLSLLPEPAVFDAGVSRLAALVAGAAVS